MDFIDIYNWASEKSVIPVHSMIDKPFVFHKRIESSQEFRIAITTRSLHET